MSEHPKQRDNSQEPEKRGDANYIWPIASKKTENDNAPKSTEQCQLCVSVFGRNIQCKLAMVAYNEILFYISYSLQLAFHLCSSMIVFYISLEDLKLAFIENKSRYVCCIFANFIFTFETKS